MAGHIDGSGHVKMVIIGRVLNMSRSSARDGSSGGDIMMGLKKKIMKIWLAPLSFYLARDHGPCTMLEGI